MYEKHFGFSKLPFSVAADPGNFYLSSTHQEALTNLHYGVQCRKGLIAVIGEPGTGKTSLLRMFVASAPPNTRTAIIYDPRISWKTMLRLILSKCGINAPRSDSEGMMRRLETHLKRELKQQRSVVLLIDEAQTLSDDLLEQLRLLSSASATSSPTVRRRSSPSSGTLPPSSDLSVVGVDKLLCSLRPVKRAGAARDRERSIVSALKRVTGPVRLAGSKRPRIVREADAALGRNRRAERGQLRDAVVVGGLASREDVLRDADLRGRRGLLDRSGLDVLGEVAQPVDTRERVHVVRERKGRAEVEKGTECVQTWPRPVDQLLVEDEHAAPPVVDETRVPGEALQPAEGVLHLSPL